MSDAANLVDLFLKSAERGGDQPFLWYKIDDVYRPWTWREVNEQIDRLALGLVAHGVHAGDRVVIVAENRPEWLIADLAILRLGAISVPTYTTNTVHAHHFILEHSEASAIIVSGQKSAEPVLAAAADLPDIRLIVAMEPMPDTPQVVAWDQVLAAADGAQGPATLERAIDPDEVACLIYTSGTGGQPKGVMLTHRIIMANVVAAIDLLEELGLQREIFLSFLPLSHSYEHTAGQFVPISINAEIYYAEGVDTLSQNLVEVRPTLLTCVPRLYEVLQQRISRQVERAGGLKAKLFKRAVELGTKSAAARALGPGEWVMDKICDRLVRRTVKERFGGRVRAMVSGGAPLNYDVGMFFLSLGLPIYQGYGQTEASPVISANRPSKRRLETVGPPLRNVEVQIAEDGEILVRGPLVMKGYWRDPEATAKTVRDGWLHTGDVGHLDDEGLLTITGRKKDIIVNSGGDNISPQRVEGILCVEPEIAQVLIYGDRRPHLVALVVPDAEWLHSFARGKGVPADLTKLANDADLARALNEAVQRANRHLSVIEKVRRIHVMSEPFSIENDMLTPTLKVRRPIVIERYRDLLEGMYTGSKAA